MGWFTDDTPLEPLYRDIGNDFFDRVVALTPEVVAAVIRISKARGIDPSVLLYILNETGDWKKKLGADSTGLQLAWTLVREGTPPAIRERRPSLDEIVAAQPALLELAQWATRAFHKQVAQAFLAALKPRLEEVRQAIVGITGKGTTEQAMKLVVQELPLRVRSHLFWFARPSLLAEVLEWLLG